MEGVLLSDGACIAVEGDTSKVVGVVVHLQNVYKQVDFTQFRSRTKTHQLDRVSTGIDPIVVVTDDLHAREPVLVHEGAKCLGDCRLLRRAHDTSWVRRIAVLGLILQTCKTGNI